MARAGHAAGRFATAVGSAGPRLTSPTSSPAPERGAGTGGGPWRRTLGPWGSSPVPSPSWNMPSGHKSDLGSTLWGARQRWFRPGEGDLWGFFTCSSRHPPSPHSGLVLFQGYVRSTSSKGAPGAIPCTRCHMSTSALPRARAHHAQRCPQLAWRLKAAGLCH